MKYKGKINTFVVLRENQDLRNLELSEGKWSSIKLISGWLEKFRDTTTQMSTTHQPMLSHTHAIFRGLHVTHGLCVGVITDTLVITELRGVRVVQIP